MKWPAAEKIQYENRDDNTPEKMAVVCKDLLNLAPILL